jgi:NADH-quinone oxidoreductase subunit L
MTIPLIILAVGALLSGYVGLPAISAIDGWLEPALRLEAEEAHHNVTLELILLGVSALVAIGGAVLAYRAYLVDKQMPANARQALGPVAKLVENKYYLDEIYNMIIVNPLRAFGGWLARSFDQGGIDGAVNGLAGVTGWIGAQVRRLQTGMVGLYALAMLFGVVALLAWLAIR